jgi:O-antigen ligase
MRVRLFASIPVLDAIANQVSNAFNLQVGPLSFLQVMRGGLLIAMLFITLGEIPAPDIRLHRKSLVAALLVVLGAVAFTIVGLIEFDELPRSNAVAYLQLAYWAFYWIVALVVCRSREYCRAVLTGIVAGALVAALSIYIGLVGGGLNPYNYQGVLASSGWFHTSKEVAGTTLVGAFSALYLGHRTRPRASVVLAVLLVAASLSTLARAAALGCALALLWIALWRLFLAPPRSNRSWALNMLGMMTLFVLAFVCVRGTYDIERRWSDVAEGKQAGSGRATFWPAAIKAYSELDIPRMAYGIGYDAMLGDMLVRYGSRIHTHNDVLDMLLTGGVVGLIILGFVWRALLALMWRLPRHSSGFVIAGAILLVWFSQSIFTGQIWSPDAMTAYIAALVALSYSERPLTRHRTGYRAGLLRPS